MMYKSLFGLSLLLALTSCDGWTENEFYIQNNTNQRLLIRVDAFQASAEDSLTLIPAGGKSLVRYTEQLGGNSEPEVPIPEYLDSDTNLVSIVTTLGDTLIKDIRNPNSWQTTSKQRSKYPSNWQHEHWFYIDSSDLE